MTAPQIFAAIEELLDSAEDDAQRKRWMDTLNGVEVPDEPYCHPCRGTGEGTNEHSSCRVCGGRGC